MTGQMTRSSAYNRG